MANENVTKVTPATPAKKVSDKPRKKFVSDPESLIQRRIYNQLQAFPDLKARARVINYLQVRLNEEAAAVTVA